MGTGRFGALSDRTGSDYELWKPCGFEIVRFWGESRHGSVASVFMGKNDNRSGGRLRNGGMGCAGGQSGVRGLRAVEIFGRDGSETAKRRNREFILNSGPRFFSGFQRNAKFGWGFIKTLQSTTR